MKRNAMSTHCHLLVARLDLTHLSWEQDVLMTMSDLVAKETR